MHSTLPSSQLLALAKYQRTMIWLVMLQVVVNILGQAASFGQNPIVGIVTFLVILGLMLLAVITGYRLAKVLSKPALGYAIALVIPCLSLVVLLLLIIEATKTLKQHGIKVGLMGASQSDLEALEKATAQPPIQPLG